MTDLTQKQIEDALTEWEILLYNQANSLKATLHAKNGATMSFHQSIARSLVSLAEARIENKRLKNIAETAFQRGREIGLSEALGIVRDTKVESEVKDE